jgi:drug/metabolite transporter (DMT)-like permease
MGATAADGAGLLRGRIMVLVAGAGMSLGGLFIRSIDAADEWQILFWRSLGIVAALLIFIALRSRGRVAAVFREAGAMAAVAGLCLATGFTFFVFSIVHTTVANTLFMLSAGPFIAAVLGRVILGEAVRRATWVAMAGAVTGIALMLGGGLATGDLFGNLMGLGAATAFAGFAVALRRGRGTDMMPATCLAGLFGAIAAGSVILVAGGGFVVSGKDLMLCLTYGSFAIGGSLIVFTLGSRFVPAAELALLSLTEVVLGPVWVWLAFSEIPSLPTLLGGAILLLAIAGQALSGIRRRPPPIGVV